MNLKDGVNESSQFKQVSVCIANSQVGSTFQYMQVNVIPVNRSYLTKPCRSIIRTDAMSLGSGFKYSWYPYFLQMARCYSPKHVSEENTRKTSYQQNNCFRSRQVLNLLLSTFKASSFYNYPNVHQKAQYMFSIKFNHPVQGNHSLLTVACITYKRYA